MSENSNKRQKITRKTTEATDGLNLGIPMVVAILIGIGMGHLLRKFTPYSWFFWLGVFWGVAAATLNVYKTYRSQVKNYGEFQQRDEFIKEETRQKEQDNGK